MNPITINTEELPIPFPERQNKFIQKAKLKHGDKYDYALVRYVRPHEKIKIICPIHGEFEQVPNNHLLGKECKECGKIKNVIGVKSFHNNKKHVTHPIKIPVNCCIIPLSQGKFTIIDKEDYDKVSAHNWFLSRSYAKNNTVGRMQRFIMGVADNRVVDHINHDTLDNRKCNLRICTSQENAMNQLPQINKSSKYKGVCYDKNRNKWFSYITKNKFRMVIGRFNNEIEAAKAYDIKAIELFGEFAYLNFRDNENIQI